MSPITILFCGRNRVGKTTIANELVNLLLANRKNAVRLAYGDCVRIELNECYGIPKRVLYDQHINKSDYIVNLRDYDYNQAMPYLLHKMNLLDSPDDYEKTSMTLRELYILHATKLRRKQAPDYWTKRFNSELASYPNLDYLVCDDSRHPDDFANFHNPMIFVLDNGASHVGDISQDLCLQWLSENQDKITDTINVKIPLLKYDASKICLNLIRNQLSQPDGLERRADANPSVENSIALGGSL